MKVQSWKPWNVLALSLVAFAASSASHAETEITRRGRYVYFKTPYKDMLVEERAETNKKALEMLIATLEENLPKVSKDKPWNAQAMNTLECSANRIEELVQRLRDFNGSDGHLEGFATTDLVPTAFMVFAGGQFTIGLKASGGGTVDIGVIVMPTRVTRLDILTRETKTLTHFETAWVGMIGGAAGLGVGGGLPFRVGIAGIWGPMRKATDFSGVMGGMATKVVLFGQGFMLKGGALVQWNKNNKMNPVAFFAWQSGPAAAAEGHLELSAVVPLGNLFRAEFENSDLFNNPNSSGGWDSGFGSNTGWGGGGWDIGSGFGLGS